MKCSSATAAFDSNTKFTLRDDIMPQIKRIVKSTLVAGKPIMEGIDGVDDYKSFMFFGFDFMVGRDGHVSLLEVNGVPAVAKAPLPQLAQISSRPPSTLSSASREILTAERWPILRSRGLH